MDFVIIQLYTYLVLYSPDVVNRLFPQRLWDTSAGDEMRKWPLPQNGWKFCSVKKESLLSADVGVEEKHLLLLLTSILDFHLVYNSLWVKYSEIFIM